MPGPGGGDHTAQRLARFQAEFPGLWETLNLTQRQRITTAASAPGTYSAFKTAVSAFPVVAQWLAANPTAPPAGEPPPIVVPTPDVPATDSFLTNQQQQETADIRGQLAQFLQENNLPASLMGFITDALANKMSFSEIITRLRQTPEYKAAYPENDLRLANGFDWWSEAQIRAYRSEAKRIAAATLGLQDVSNAEIAQLIATNKSLSEWETNLQTYRAFERWGPAVQQALSQELGYDVSDARTYAFMSAEIPTPELDLAYTRSLMRGQPAVLGFGIRPEEEADILLQHGIDPTRAFAGYQGIAAELPRVERLRLINNYIATNPDQFPTNALAGASYADLFSAIQLRDPEALLRLAQMSTIETARWQATGGAARSGSQLVGLLPGGRQAV